MLRITFKYRDQYCRDGSWNTQTCVMRSVDECIKWYGLDQCEYQIIDVQEV